MFASSDTEIFSGISDYLHHKEPVFKHSGPSCSKLTTSLVNDSLKFTSSDIQIC